MAAYMIVSPVVVGRGSTTIFWIVEPTNEAGVAVEPLWLMTFQVRPPSFERRKPTPAAVFGVVVWP
jgi:hypothetical protein